VGCLKTCKYAAMLHCRDMQNDIAKVLYDKQAIANRIKQVARQIADDFADTDQNTEITIIPILTGSFIFVADLIRELPLRMQIRLMSVSSYPGKSMSSKPAHIRHELTDLPDSLEGRHVLVVDDILDSGQTLQLVTETLQQRDPVSLKTCVLLRKQRPEAMAFSVDYVCFDIPDEFVVGYGLDFDDYYRNLPEIVVLHESVTHTGGGDNA